jgi:hypothetical protein
VVSGDNNFEDNRKYNSSAPKYDPCVLAKKLGKLPITTRLSVRNAAIALNMPWSSLFKYTKQYGACSDNEQQTKQIKKIKKTTKTSNPSKPAKKPPTQPTRRQPPRKTIAEQQQEMEKKRRDAFFLYLDMEHIEEVYQLEGREYPETLIDVTKFRIRQGPEKYLK